MKFGNRATSILYRLIYVPVGGIICLVLFSTGIHGWMAGEIDLLKVVERLLMICGLLLVIYIPLIETAPGELTEEGVYIRILLIRRFYPWDKIQQAGVLWRMGRGMRYNELVLLKPGGSPRRYRDRLFVFRNLFRLIRIPYSPAARDYIARHYGPLDFDLSDGGPEQSIVVD